MLRISWTDHITNETIGRTVGIDEEPLAQPEAQDGRKILPPDSVLLASIEGEMPGSKKRGRPMTRWSDNIEKWTIGGLQRASHCAWRRQWPCLKATARWWWWNSKNVIFLANAPCYLKQNARNRNILFKCNIPVANCVETTYNSNVDNVDRFVPVYCLNVWICITIRPSVYLVPMMRPIVLFSIFHCRE